MGFSRQAYWSGFPFPTPGDLPHPRIDPVSPTLPGGFFATEPSGKLSSFGLHVSPYKETCWLCLDCVSTPGPRTVFSVFGSLAESDWLICYLLLHHKLLPYLAA